MGFFDNKQFDASKVEPSTGFAAIPEGDYRCVIMSVEEKRTKAGTGSYANFKVQVLGPTHKGRIIFDMVTLTNPNRQAVDIGESTLSAICRAVGCMQPRSWSDVCNQPFMCKVGHRKFNDELQNCIKQYMTSDQQETTQRSESATDNPAPWG